MVIGIAVSSVNRKQRIRDRRRGIPRSAVWTNPLPLSLLSRVRQRLVPVNAGSRTLHHLDRALDPIRNALQHPIRLFRNGM